MKKIVAFTLCIIFTFSSAFSVKTFAALEDIKILGGSYEKIRESVSEYKKSPDHDDEEYHCHHLISREALNTWSNHIISANGGLIGREYKFLTDSEIQYWTPSIIMEKEDHEKTLSFCCEDSTKEQKEFSKIYRNYQARKIINNGDIIGILDYETKLIKNIFGEKYNRAIKEVWAYINSLEFRHSRHGILSMKNPYNGTKFEIPFGVRF